MTITIYFFSCKFLFKTNKKSVIRKKYSYAKKLNGNNLNGTNFLFQNGVMVVVYSYFYW